MYVRSYVALDQMPLGLMRLSLILLGLMKQHCHFICKLIANAVSLIGNFAPVDYATLVQNIIYAAFQQKKLYEKKFNTTFFDKAN